ncbi:MAG: LysM peptidoglycan-binding domain-containing protein [Acidimicrobiales bacterium]
MTRRLADLIRGLASLIVIVALTVGVPLLLWRFGGLPGVRIIDTLNDPLASDTTRSEALLSGTLLIIAWACWAQLAYAVIVEAIAAVRGRTARRAPVLPGLQAVAARLIASAALITSSMISNAQGAAAVAPLQRLADSPVESGWILETTPPQSTATETGRTTATLTAAKTYTTQSRDTFWDIAESTLGDGLRWTEIRDANLGRAMPDGTTITRATETVHTGWDLQLPDDAVLPLADEADVAANHEVEVEAGDHFWSIAEEAMTDAWGRDPSDTEIAPYWADVVELNTDRLLPPDDPNLIYPGQVFELPTVPTDPLAPAQPKDEVSEPDVVDEPEQILPPATEPETTTPVIVAESTTPVTVADEPAPTTTVPSTSAAAKPAAESTETLEAAEGSSTESAPISVFGVGALGISAGALALTLRRLRVHQAARREPGTQIEEPPSAAVEYESAVRPIADTDSARWIEATNKLLSSRLAKSGQTALPAVVAMQVGKFGVELLLDEPCAPPEGFIQGPDSATTWRIDPALELDDIVAETEGTHAYCPALLPVGRTPAGDLLIDFEQVGALAVGGDPKRAAGWQRALAVAATSTPWSTDCELVAIGLADDVGGLANVTVPTDPEAWAKACVAEMGKLNERLTDTPYRQRVSPGELFYPRIVLIGPGHDDLARQLAYAAALVNAPLAVVAYAELPVAERIHFTDGDCVIEPYGLPLEPLNSPPTEAARVSELLDNAESAPVRVAEPEQADVVSGDNEPQETVEEILERVMAPKPIEVEILRRQPRVRGLDKDMPTKNLSVLCYLAYRREVSSQRLREAFWPTATHRSTADNALSQIRRALGTDEAGEHRLTSAANGGNYELSDDIGCDWTRALALIEAAKARPADQAAQLIGPALQLVDGAPGIDAPSGSFDWLVDDPTTYRRIESLLVDAAFRVGEYELEAGEPSRAEEVARRGLILVPGNEALFRILMRAAAARHDFDEVDRLYGELCAHLTQHSVWDTPDEETEAILRSTADLRKQAG